MHYSNDPRGRLALASLAYFTNWGEMVGGDCGFRNRDSRCWLGLRTSSGSGGTWPGCKRWAWTHPCSLADDLRDVMPSLQTEGVAGARLRAHQRVRRRRRHDPLASRGRPRGSARRSWKGRPSRRSSARAVGSLASARDGDTLSAHGGGLRRQHLVASVAEDGGRRSAGHAASGSDIATGSDRLPMPGPIWWCSIRRRRCTRERTAMGRSSAGRPTRRAALPADPGPVRRSGRSGFPTRCNHGCGSAPLRSGRRAGPAEAGLYDMSPDTRAILDRVPGVAGLYLAAGFSGTGFKKAPAVGPGLAELITAGQATSVDLAPFRYSPASSRRAPPIHGDDEYEGARGWGHAF